MEMDIISKEKKLCFCCMEEHEVATVRMKDHTIFKGEQVEYVSECFYCDRADEYFMDETMTSENDIRMKDAYRQKTGLLTSDEILRIRSQYGITQKDLCTVLGWGQKTITRYESHQIQDMAHDSILCKLGQDPEWFLVLLDKSREQLSSEAYKRYHNIAAVLYEKNQDLYLRKTIEAEYAAFSNSDVAEYSGNTHLSLDKVVDCIRYFSDSERVTRLFKVKLMKLLWYMDAYSCKVRDQAITGLVYRARQSGAVPIGHDFIIELNGIVYEEVSGGDYTGYHFLPSGNHLYPNLTGEDREIMDIIINRFGLMSKDEIMKSVHREQAYLNTPLNKAISFKYSKELTF